MSLWLNIVLIFVFMLLGGVFSCSEMALVSLRGSQIEQMEQDDARGARVARVARDPNRFLSAVQIGVTLSGFLSASFGASSLAPYFTPWVVSLGCSPSVAGTIVTIVLTLIISYFSIVISELTPKRIALQRAEQIARAVVPAIDVFATICKPLIWLIGKNTNLLVRLMGLDPNETQSEVSDDELRVLVSTNTNLSKDERVILEDVFGAAETSVSEVMRPRADVVFLDGDDTIEKAAAFVRDMPYSRYPVIGKDFDDVLGFVHVRDLLDVRDPDARYVADVTRQGIKLPGTSRLLPSLSLLRKSGIHLAVVIDEYGGTDGIVTLEDMTEELVGDIRDEYDLPEPVSNKTDNTFRNGYIDVDGGMTLEDFHDLTGIELEDGPYETLAGYMLAHSGELGYVGMTVQTEFSYDMVVTAVDGRRIQTIRVRKREDGAGAGDGDGAGAGDGDGAGAGAGDDAGAGDGDGAEHRDTPRT